MRQTELERLSFHVGKALGAKVELRLIYARAGRSHVYLDDRRGVVVKRFSSDDGPDRRDVEACANVLMARTAPVPEILAQANSPGPWLAMRRLPGTLWQDLERQRRVAHDGLLWVEAGRMLADIHRIDHAPGVPKSHASAYYRLRADRALSSRTPNRELIAAARQELYALEDEIGVFSDASLVHRDFSPRNLLVAGRANAHLSGLIDFERARLGDPAEDLAMVLLKQLIGHHTGYLEFERAYLSSAPPVERLRDRVLYHLIGLAIEIAGWAFEKDAGYYRDTMQALRTVLEEPGAVWTARQI